MDKRHCWPTIVAAVLTAAGIITILCINQLSAAERVTNIILALTCFGVLASFFYLINNYNIMRSSYLKSLQPALLIQVVTPKVANASGSQQSSPQPRRTIIKYRNPTNNAFEDLTIYCKVCLGNECVNYDYLFSTNMYMGPYDDRNRRFDIENDLLKKGHNINQLASSGTEVRLVLSFQYSFLEQTITQEVQQYKWDPKIRQWEIV